MIPTYIKLTKLDTKAKEGTVLKPGSQFTWVGLGYAGETPGDVHMDYKGKCYFSTEKEWFIPVHRTNINRLLKQPFGPSQEKAKNATVYLTHSEREALRQIGKGNASAGARAVLQFYQLAQKQHTAGDIP